MNTNNLRGRGGNQFSNSIQCVEKQHIYFDHQHYLRSSITALGSHLVDLRLSNVSPLLCLIQFMLQFTEFGQMAVSLFLLSYIV